MRLDGLMLWVADVTASVAFDRDAFGIEPRWVRDEGDHAQLETGTVTLQLAAASAAPSTGVDRPCRRGGRPRSCRARRDRASIGLG